MNNASFSWSAIPGSLPVLHDISMDVNPGALVVVVGPVASGKSTLVSGVFGFAQLVAGKSTLRGVMLGSWWVFFRFFPMI